MVGFFISAPCCQTIRAFISFTFFCGRDSAGSCGIMWCIFYESLCLLSHMHIHKCGLGSPQSLFVFMADRNRHINWPQSLKRLFSCPPAGKCKVPPDEIVCRMMFQKKSGYLSNKCTKYFWNYKIYKVYSGCPIKWWKIMANNDFEISIDGRQ